MSRKITIFIMAMLLSLNFLPVFGLAISPEGPMADDNGPGAAYFNINSYFSEYHTYETMLMHLEILQGQFPDIIRLYDLTENTGLGRTYQGRSVWAVKVGKGVGSEAEYYDDPAKPNVLIFGAHHGREWMSYEVCIYTAFYLAYNYDRSNVDDDGDTLVNEDLLDGLDNDNDGLIDEDPSQGRVNYLVDNREIWIIPMINPDGVAYDHTISRAGTGGGWRKNLRNNIPPLTDEFDPDSDGVDLNRNYPYMWWANSKGSVINPDGVVIAMDSANPTSDVYRGPPDGENQDGDSGTMGLIPRVDEDPVDGIDNDGDGRLDEDRDGGFSEPETQAMGALVKTFDDQPDTGNIPFVTSISYHSVAGLVLWPWGYTRRSTPHDSLFKDVGNRLAEATGYQGMQATSLYPASGDSEDWLYGSGNILAFTIELDGPDGGFHPATEHIIPICKKALAANLGLFDLSDRIEVAKQYHLTLDQAVVGVKVANIQTVVKSDEDILIQAEILNEDKMVPDSLTLYYSQDGEKYQQTTMEFHRSSGYYGTIIKDIPPGTTLRYYITVRDVSGITAYAPDYGPYDPHSIDISPESGLSTLENVIMVIMMFSILLVVWGGFVGLILMAFKAEKRKSKLTA
ncbi:MAG: M14 family metallopeptidase [Candidatus Thermoplasmatota archaeon]|jgi:hypothetical protein|nr:M14 family metallopeptidase [Candidatus Thermoplasmatota archaeon]MDP7264251.1 M14 family metallopeptidase [Candidatus Thermoplasmatota archaeon]